MYLLKAPLMRVLLLASSSCHIYNHNSFRYANLLAPVDKAQGDCACAYVTNPFRTGMKKILFTCLILRRSRIRKIN